MTKIILIVLVVAVLSGGAGYYLGMIGSKASSTANTTSETINPFATEGADTNPFGYSNPFSDVKGISTQYVNPFDGLDQFNYRSPKTKGKIAY